MTRPSGSTPVGGAPVGPASGDLVGSFPAPVVARVRGRLWSSQAPAVDDVPLWDGTQWLPSPMFGAKLAQDTRLTSLTTSNSPSNPVTYMSLGSVEEPIPLVADHVYIGITSYVVLVSATNTTHWLDVRINGAPSVLGPTVEPIGEANAQTLRTNILTFTGAEVGPSVRYNMVFAKSSGAGSVTLRAATIAIWRIA